MFQVIFIFFDWILMKQIYYKTNFITDSFQYFANTLRAPLTVSGSLYIVSNKKCTFLDMSAKFVIKSLPFS